MKARVNRKDWNNFVTGFFVPQGTEIEVDVKKLIPIPQYVNGKYAGLKWLVRGW